MLKIGLISIGFPNFRYDLAQKNLDKTLEYMRKKDVELFSCDRVLIYEEDIESALDDISSKGVDLFILELGTYSYGSVLMSVLNKIKGADLLMWGFREPIVEGYSGLPLNSLCALNMYTSFLKKIKRDKYSYIYGDIDEEQTLIKFDAIIKAAEIKKNLAQARFCIVGGRVPGFYLSNVDELNFRKEIGPEIVYYSIASLINDAQRISDAEVAADIERTKALVARVTTTEQALERSSRIYLAIKKFARENNISGFAIKCWPDFQEIYNLAVCGVVSRLNNEGITTSCEGDITGLTTMYIQKHLTSLPVFLTDLVNISMGNVVKLWHCGAAAPLLAHNPSSTSYEEHPTIKNGIGMAANLELRHGKIVMCKLVEDQPYKMLLTEGEIIEPDRELIGNQGDVAFNFTGEQLLEVVAREGIEHHYSIAYNADASVIRELCKLMGVRIIEVK